MLRPTQATLALVLALGAPLALPGLSAADSGGAPPNTGGAASPAPAPTATASAVASAAGSNGVTLVGRSGAIVRATQRFRGTVAAGAGKTVVVQVLLPAGAWTTVATTTTRADGSFLARW